MNARVFYHSSTGNTGLVARGLVKRFEARGAGAEALDITGLDGPPKLDGAHIFGFGYPVMYWRHPFAVTDFIESLPPADGRPAFVFCTMGGDPANSFAMMEKELNRRGFRVVGALGVRSEDNHPALRNRGVTGRTPWPSAADMDRIDGFVRRMERKGRQAEQGLKPSRCLIPTGLITPLGIGGMLLDRKWLTRFTGARSVNVDACIRCGRCARRCPVKAVELAPTPRFLDHCIACWGCYNLCPTRAVDFSLAKGGGHYTGPDEHARRLLLG